MAEVSHLIFESDNALKDMSNLGLALILETTMYAKVESISESRIHSARRRTKLYIPQTLAPIENQGGCLQALTPQGEGI